MNFVRRSNRYMFLFPLGDPGEREVLHHPGHYIIIQRTDERVAWRLSSVVVEVI